MVNHVAESPAIGTGLGKEAAGQEEQGPGSA
jgi:hypothetical protein